jgi:PAS domain S-box-containing protein
MQTSDTRTASAAVLPLVAEDGNRRLLEEWLGDHEAFRLVEPDDALSELSFDVAILDEGGLQRHIEGLERVKEEAAPVLVPYLLLVPEPGTDLIELEGGELVENVLTRQIDEIVTLPIKQAELQWRIDSLLRLREQSLQARERERTLTQYQRAVEGATDMLAAVDTDYRFLFANERYRQFHGLAAEDVRSLTLREVLGEETFEAVEPRLDRVMDGSVIQFEAERTNSDGQTRILETYYYPLEDEDGSVVGGVAAMRDVTDRQERKRELERQLDLFEKTQAIADVGAWEYDLEAEEGYWTDEVSRIHGLDEDVDVSPELSVEHYHPDDRPTIREAFGRAVEAGESYDLELRLIDADGEQRWVRTRGEPQYENGEVVRVRGTLQDITDRKERERTLRRTRRAVEASGYAIYITDADGAIEYVNPAFEEITGYPEAEAVGRTPSILRSREMPEDYYEELWETVRSGEVWEEELVNRRKDGELYHARQTIAPIRDDDGGVEGFVAIQSDITEQVEATQELETFRDIVQRVDDPIMLQDLDGQFRVLNEAVAEYAERPVEELLGRDEFAFMDERAATEIARQKEWVLAEERPRTYEVTPSFPTKGSRRFKTTRYPHYDEAGDLDGTVAICRDVTDLVERERQLAVVDRVLRHNLRSEITIIQGYAEHIAENPTADSEAPAREIRVASDSLQSLAEKERKIVEVLTQAGSPKSFELCEVLDRVVAGVTDAYPDSEVVVECPDGLQVRALVEFEEALYEVVENAVKHADVSSPHVTVTAGRENGSITVSVADSGPGIPEMERGVLEGDADIEPLTHGSGLGLWFVNHVVAQSGGSVRFRANGSRGSVVDISVPSADGDDGTESP